MKTKILFVLTTILFGSLTSSPLFLDLNDNVRIAEENQNVSLKNNINLNIQKPSRLLLPDVDPVDQSEVKDFKDDDFQPYSKAEIDFLSDPEDGENSGYNRRVRKSSSKREIRKFNKNIVDEILSDPGLVDLIKQAYSENK